MKREEAELFVRKGVHFLQSCGLPISEWSIDHLCYRVETEERYFSMKNALENEGKLLIESKIGGRMISSFLLNQPFEIAQWTIPVLELPAPKQGAAYPEGYDHFEVVVPFSLEKLIKNFPDLAWDTSAINKAHNREIRLWINDWQSVKFHEKSLADCIAQELGG
ncbi:VOC family protein [Cytophagales bacterium LB-30]|uniref:VOC family protein n=1 Tax=Shiella aurantiaca TaxID=3058365 RepID=A0ABT8F1A6_9BACT|nr:VOC family protein [Shiella aurantiaca]MDN4164232.1 VOC family protein [Shiella aurantiaca]